MFWTANVLANPGCMCKSVAPKHGGKTHDTTYKMAMTLGIKMKIIDYEFPFDCICHVVSICHIIFTGDERVV